MARWTRRAMLLLLAAVVLVTGLVALVRVWTYESVRGSLYQSAVDVPPQDVVVVLASGARRTGPSAAAVKRLDAAIELFRRGGARSILVSGQYFEVTAMQRYLLQAGISPETIATDDESQRTFDSCDHVKRTYPSQHVVVVSQAEHVARAVYTCRALGVEASGLVAPDFDGVAFVTYRVHELFALPIAWWDVHLATRS